jgi:hypothetical protein
MKKLFFTLAIALGTLTVANAQEAGKMWVGGTVGIWSSKVKGGDSQLSYKILPELGYTLTDNIGVGISVGGGHTHTGDLKFEGTDSAKGAANFYRVNPFLRYTFLKGDLGSLFLDGGVSYEWAKGVSGGAHGHMWQAGIKPGVALNVSNKISLLGKFGFIGYEAQNGGSRSFGLDLDMSNIELGMNLKF